MCRSLTHVARPSSDDLQPAFVGHPGKWRNIVTAEKMTGKLGKVECSREGGGGGGVGVPEVSHDALAPRHHVRTASSLISVSSVDDGRRNDGAVQRGSLKTLRI